MNSERNRFDHCPEPIADAVDEFIGLSGVLTHSPKTTDFYKMFRRKLGQPWKGYVNGVLLPVLRDELEQCKALDFSEHAKNPIADASLYPEMMRLHRLVQDAISAHLDPYIGEERIKAVEAGMNRSNNELRCLAARETDWGEAATELHDVLLVLCDLLVEMEHGPACRSRRTPLRSGRLGEKFDFGDYREPLENWFEGGQTFNRGTLSIPDIYDSPWSPSTRFCEAFEILDEDSVEWCDRLTEIEEYLQGDIRDPEWPTGIQRLDKRYCQTHRRHYRGPNWDKLPSFKKLYASILSVEAEDEAARNICQAFLSKIHGDRKKQQPVAPLGGRIHCKVCTRRTERQALNQGRHSMTEADRKSVPSSEFCHYHRTIGHDGSWDKSRQRSEKQSTYQSRIDKIPIFAAEFERLLKTSPSRHARHPSSCSPAVRYFIERVMQELNCYPDEDEDMRRIAWEIVEHGINDRKKTIVSLAAWGLRQIDIAKKLEVTPQAISKSLKSIPPAYRFDQECSQLGAEDKSSV